MAQFTFDANQVRHGLSALDDRSHSYLLAISNFHAQHAQGRMRTDAPWTDRTSNARNGLAATPFNIGREQYGAILYHQVPYGIWLEVAHAARYAAIGPVLSSEGRQFMLSVASMFAAIAG